jgi:hypothetical protein
MGARTYWAAEDSESLAKSINQKVIEFDQYLEESGRITITRRATDLYYGFDADGGWANSSAISFGGEQGETTLLRVNHFRSVVDQRVIQVTAQRPNFDAMAINTDYNSANEAKLAENIFEYHLSRKGLEEACRDATRKSRTSGEGWLLMTWDPFGGYMYAAEPVQLPDGQMEEKPAFSGEPRYRTFACYDVIRDPNRRDTHNDWIAVRYDESRWDLMANYPEKADEIQSYESGGRSRQMRDKILRRTRERAQDQVEVYEWYHRKSPALPQGRFVKVVGTTVLFDGPLPYEEIPCYMIAEDIEPDSNFGHSKDWDLIAPQQLLDSAISTIATNHDAFGIQNILIPEGANIDTEDLGGGLRTITYQPGLGEPKVLQLTSSGEASYKLIEFAVGTIETLSSINSVARGNPEASLRTGTALALVDSKAMQGNSGLIQAYTRFLENVGTALIKLYQTFAAAPHIIEIVGVDQRSAVINFTSDKISNVCRIVVTTGNAVMRSQAGRMEVMQMLAQNFPGQITPQQAFAVMETGRLEEAYQRPLAEPRYIKLENEQMSNGEQPKALYTDTHEAHIEEHMVLTFDPSIRNNEQLMWVVLGHIMQHRQFQSQQNMAMIAAEAGPLPGEPPGPQAPGEKPAQGPANSSGEGGGMPMMPQNPATGQRPAADGSQVG